MDKHKEVLAKHGFTQDQSIGPADSSDMFHSRWTRDSNTHEHEVSLTKDGGWSHARDPHDGGSDVGEVGSGHGHENLDSHLKRHFHGYWDASKGEPLIKENLDEMLASDKSPKEIVDALEESKPHGMPSNDGSVGGHELEVGKSYHHPGDPSSGYEAHSFTVLRKHSGTDPHGEQSEYQVKLLKSHSDLGKKGAVVNDFWAHHEDRFTPHGGK